MKFDQSGAFIKALELERNLPDQRTDQLDRWKTEVGFQEGPVRVHKFRLDPYRIGIADLPSGMQQAIDDPDEFDQEELEMVKEDIKGWLKDGQFVLDWGEEYYLNADGRVVCS